MNNKTRFITKAAVIAAMYVVLTYLTNIFGLANGAVQVRISEALTVLPYFTASAVPGLFAGCIISNVITGCTTIDIIFGSLATLIGALGTRLLRKYRYLASLPPVLSNAVIIPFVLKYAYGLDQGWLYLVVTVGAGEIISCSILGMLLLKSLEKKSEYLFD